MPENDASLQARVLCAQLGIVGWRKESEVAERIAWVSASDSITKEAARIKMVTAYEAYKLVRSRLDWVYASPYAFLFGDIWQDEALWPWIRATPRPDATVGMNTSPQMTDADIAYFSAKRSPPV